MASSGSTSKPSAGGSHVTVGESSSPKESGNGVTEVDIERQATKDSARSKAKRKSKSPRKKSSLGKHRAAFDDPSSPISTASDDDIDDAAVEQALKQRDPHTKTYQMTRSLSPYWYTTRGKFTIAAAILFVVCAIIGGTVGSVLGTREAKKEDAASSSSAAAAAATSSVPITVSSALNEAATPQVSPIQFPGGKKTVTSEVYKLAQPEPTPLFSV